MGLAVEAGLTCLVLAEKVLHLVRVELGADAGSQREGVARREGVAHWEGDVGQPEDVARPEDVEGREGVALPKGVEQPEDVGQREGVALPEGGSARLMLCEEVLHPEHVELVKDLASRAGVGSQPEDVAVMHPERVAMLKERASRAGAELQLGDFAVMLPGRAVEPEALVHLTCEEWA